MFPLALGPPSSGLSEPVDFVSGIRVPASCLSSMFSFRLGVDVPLVSAPHVFSTVVSSSYHANNPSAKQSVGYELFEYACRRLGSTEPVDLSSATNRRLAAASGTGVGYGLVHFCCGIDRGCTRHPVELEQ
jgi:hypothetical protein